MPHHIQLALTVNGEPTEVAFAPYKTLLEVLREDLNLCGTKHGCELGECGACAVLLDGQPVLSCLVLGAECEGRDVLTIEGLATDGRLHPLQETFADLGAAQCGYCTPGFLVTAKALLDEIPDPSRDQIREALAGCLCRCTGYQQIFEAVEAAVERSARTEGERSAKAFALQDQVSVDDVRKSAQAFAERDQRGAKGSTEQRGAEVSTEQRSAKALAERRSAKASAAGEAR
jgi:aerobic-type carbon monoxide dehydrogenase small subunit (CoxS/CutS family)